MAWIPLLDEVKVKSKLVSFTTIGSATGVSRLEDSLQSKTIIGAVGVSFIANVFNINNIYYMRCDTWGSDGKLAPYQANLQAYVYYID